MIELTEEQKKQLLRAGYPPVETMRMVEMKLSGLGNDRIGKKWGKSKSAVRHQLAFYEKLTGEILPRHTKVKSDE